MAKMREKRMRWSQLVFFSISLRSVSYNLGHAAILVTLVWEEGWGVHDKLCKLFWRVNIFSAPGVGRVSPKLTGRVRQNKKAPALSPLSYDRSLET